MYTSHVCMMGHGAEREGTIYMRWHWRSRRNANALRAFRLSDSKWWGELIDKCREQTRKLQNLQRLFGDSFSVLPQLLHAWEAVHNKPQINTKNEVGEW